MSFSRTRFSLEMEANRLSDGVLYAGSPAEPGKDSVTAFERLEEDIPVESLFASISSEKRVREKDIGELVRD
ncbi:MAG: hypothetical protein R6X21_00815, partial [Candidatus Aminicenantes bacterium]